MEEKGCRGKREGAEEKSLLGWFGNVCCNCVVMIVVMCEVYAF